MKKPREYQVDAATALWNHVHTSFTRRPLVVMPTGSGKSLTMALFISGIATTYPHTRIVSVVHREEIVKSNAGALAEMMPQAPIGVYAAGMGRREIRQITFAMIDSVAKRAAAFGHIDFLLVDEAHRISDKETTTYVRFINELKAKNPNLVVIGFTATDYRMGSGKLTESGIFDDICYDLSSGEAFIWMLEQGYLVRPTSKPTSIRVDEHDISIKMGEYDATQSAFEFEKILEPCVDEMILKGSDRQAWLVFAQNLDQADHIADMLNFKGVSAVSVHSKMKGSREDALAKHKRGEYQAVVNKDILTTGYDDPRIDLIAMMRLTNSVGLWVQMLGRGTRPLFVNHIGHNGSPPLHDITTREGRLASIAESPKQNCLVLDFAGNITRLGPINYPNVPKKKKGSAGDPPVRECPQCSEYVHISIKICPECGYEFPEKPKLRAYASEGSIVEDRSKPKEKEYGIFGVGQMVFSRHQARDPNKPVSMKVDYFCGIRRFSAWVCPEHHHPFPKSKAIEWWRMHQEPTDKSPVPRTVEDMMLNNLSLRKPKFIKVWLNTKYPEIVDYDFRGTRFELPPEFGGPPLQEPTEALAAAAAMAHADEQEQKDNERMRAAAREMFDDGIPF